MSCGMEQVESIGWWVLLIELNRGEGRLGARKKPREDPPCEIIHQLRSSRMIVKTKENKKMLQPKLGENKKKSKSVFFCLLVVTRSRSDRNLIIFSCSFCCSFSCRFCGCVGFVTMANWPGGTRTGTTLEGRCNNRNNSNNNWNSATKQGNECEEPPETTAAPRVDYSRRVVRDELLLITG